MADRFRIQNNLETLRDFSAPGEEGTTRLSYTPAYRQAVDYLKKEMEAAGLRTWEDGVGNVYGELKGTDETAPVILSGFPSRYRPLFRLFRRSGRHRLCFGSRKNVEGKRRGL